MADVKVQTYDSTGSADRPKAEAEGIDIGQEGIVGENLAADPATPASSHVKIYPKADKWYQIDDTGTVTSLVGGGIENVVEDTTPQLGGNLDLNGNYITGIGSLAGLNGPPTNQWLFTESSFGTAKDSGAIGDYDLDVVTGDPQSAAGPSGFGSELAIDFDTNDYIKGSATFPRRLTQDFSMAMRVSMRAAGDAIPVFAAMYDSAPSPVLIYTTRASGALTAAVYNEAGQYKAATTGTGEIVFDEGWHWLFITYSRATSTIKVRVDGNTPVTASYTDADSQLKQKDVALWLSSYSLGTQPMNGKMAYAGFWDRELSESEMDAIDGNTIENLCKSSDANVVLKYNEALSQFENRLPYLEHNADVEATAPAHKDSLLFNKVTRKWEAEHSLGATYLQLDDIDAPSQAPAGTGHLYKGTANDGLLYARDGLTQVLDLTRPRIDINEITNVATDLVLPAPPINQWLLNEPTFGTATDTGTNADYDLDSLFGTAVTSLGFPGFGAGTAMQLDGSADISGTGAYPLRFTEDFSVAMLIRPDELDKTSMLAFCGDGTTGINRVFWMYLTPDNKLNVGVHNSAGTAKTAVTAATVSLNTWHWCIFTYKKLTGLVTLRLDDTTAATDLFGSDTQANQLAGQVLTFGGNLPARGAQGFNGLVDAAYVFDYALEEVAINSITAGGDQNIEDFNKSITAALSNNQILKYNSAVTSFQPHTQVVSDNSDVSTTSIVGLTGPPIHQYLFNEGATTAADSGSIGDLPLTVLNSTPDIVAGRPETGQENAMFFDRSTSESIASAVVMPKRFLDDFSVAVLINPTDLDAGLNTICSINGTGQDGFAWWLRYDAALNFICRVNDQTPIVPLDLEATATGLTDGNWHWVFLTYDKSTGTVLARVDDGAGGKTSTNAFAAGETQIRQNNGVLRVATMGEGLSYPATMSVHSLAIWDRKLSVAEMDAIVANTAIEDFYADPAAATGNELLVYSKVADKFASHKIRIGDLDKTDLDTPQSGQIPRYDGVNWVGADHGDMPTEITLLDQAAPVAPGSGKGELFKLTGNRNLFWKPDAETDSERVTNQSSLDDIGGVATNIVAARPTNQWKLNESTFGTASDSGTGTAYDLSENAGTLASGEGFPNFGEPSAALTTISDTDSYLRGSTTFPLVSGSFSVVALVKSADTTRDMAIFGLGDSGADEVFLMYQTSGGLLNSFAWSDTTETPPKQLIFANNNPDTKMTEGQWHWCFLTYDKPNNILTTRLDNKPITTAAFTNSDTLVFQHSTAKAYIGNRVGAETNHQWIGFIDLVAYYDGVVLTGADMDAIYDNGNQEQEDLVKTSPVALAANQALLYDTEASAFVNQPHVLDKLSDADTTVPFAMPYRPIHQYLFNESSYTSGATDSGRLGDYDLSVPTGTPTSEAGLTGMGEEKSVRFTTSSYLSGAAPFYKRFQNDVSFAALVKPNSSSGDHAIATLMSTGTSAEQSAWALRFRNGTLDIDAVIYSYDGIATGVKSCTAVGAVISTWHWVFFSFDRSTGTATIRLDDGAGSKTGTVAFNIAGTPLNQLADVVLRAGSAPGPTWNADMNIHSMYVYDRLLTSGDFDTIYASGAQTVENLAALPTQDGNEVLRYDPASLNYVSNSLLVSDLGDVDATLMNLGYILRSDGEKLVAVEDQPLAQIRLPDVQPVAAPGSGFGNIYKLAGSRHILWKPDSDVDGERLNSQSSLDALSGVAAPIVSARPYHQYRFNESSFASGAADSGTASAIDLDVVAGTLISAEGFPGFGEPSSAVAFKSITASLKSTIDFPDIAEDFSIVAVVRVTSAPAAGDVIAIFGESGEEVFNLKIANTSGQVSSAVFKQSPHSPISAGPSADTAIPLNTWNWVFLTYVASTGTLTVRVNDNTPVSATFGGTQTLYSPAPGTPLIVGNTTAGSSDFPGEIDMIALYDEALSTDDINSIYAEGLQDNEDLVRTTPNALASKQALLYDTEASAFSNRAITHDDISGNGSATVSTTDATVTTIATIPIAAGTISHIKATVIAKDANGDGAAYELSAHVKDVAATTTLQNVTQTYIDEDVASMDATVTVSGNDALIRVTGDASIAADWKCTYTAETL